MGWLGAKGEDGNCTLQKSRDEQVLLNHSSARTSQRLREVVGDSGPVLAGNMLSTFLTTSVRHWGPLATGQYHAPT